MTVLTSTDELPESIDDALYSTLSDIIRMGERVESRDSSTREIIAYQTGMSQPRARIVGHPMRGLNVTTAVARFVWMMAGNDRLEDIAFYEPRVRRFSDDGLSVPGSNYGNRILRGRPGLDQVKGVVNRLKGDSDSRRAAVVIWTAEDAVRDSSDIPCAFGLFFHIRSGGLVATCIMRSNNALRLLPFNAFEFSLLSEIVAAEVKVPLTAYIHWAASMHVYEADRGLAERVVAAGPGTAMVMPPVPVTAPLGQVAELAKAEARMRYAGRPAELAAIRDSAAQTLDSYWLAFLDVLLVHRLKSLGYAAEADAHASDVPAYFSRGIRDGIAA